MKIDYNKEMENILATLPAFSSRKKLLLHACCGPCSSAVLERLSDFFAITILFYNPNIYPQLEYSRRKDELKKFLTEFPQGKTISVIEEPYEPNDFYEAINIAQEPELKTELERGERCKRCYQLRLQKTFDYAISQNFDFFTTTLSISPHKDSEKINSIGTELTKGLSSPQFLYADFKKKNGFKRSLELSAEYNLYRQDYCGCLYSYNQSKNKQITDTTENIV